MSVTEPVSELWSLSRPTGELTFACPSCEGALTLPETQANAEGPCPLCQALIIGPDPEEGLGARLASPAVIEAVRIHCGACDASLEVDVAAEVESGPCPACGTWIELDGQPCASAPAPAGPPFPDSREAPPSADGAGRDAPGEDGIPRSSEAPVPADLGLESVADDGPWRPWPSPEAPRETALPAESASSGRSEPPGPPDFPGVTAQATSLEPSSATTASHPGRRVMPSPPPSRLPWWVLALTMLLSVGVSLGVAAKFQLIDWLDLRFWDPASPSASPPAAGETAVASKDEGSGSRLFEGIERQARALADREEQGLEAARLTLERFLSAPTWESAREELQIVFPATAETTLAALADFPRDTLLGRDFEWLDYRQRIPGTDRYVFPLRLVPLEAGAEAPLFFLLEEEETGRFRIHAEHLLQNWREQLTAFLETPGAAEGRFYVWVARGKGLLAGESAVTLPEGRYAKVRLLDYFSRNNQRQYTGYVKIDSPAGALLLARINEAQWKAGVLELAWAEGPQGDVFIEVTGLVPSNWGDFVK